MAQAASLFQTSDSLWLRYPALSPDGTTIAFTYQGNLFSVPAQGGRAQQLTTHAAYDSRPVWSPDSRRIAFSSDREGSMDVWLIDREGGTPKRLTTHSGSEVPMAFHGNDRVVFTTALMPTTSSLLPADHTFPQVYEVSVHGGRPIFFSSHTMEDLRWSPDGTAYVYHDKKGYEDPWRKHHTSSIARDLWLCAPDAQGVMRHRKLTEFAGEDRTPVWSRDGKTVFYLTEQDGTFNVAQRTLDAAPSAAGTLLTHHRQHPVRFLTAADNGILCYGWDGGIYTLQPGQTPQRVSIRIVTDRTARDLVRQVRGSGASEIALSPDEKEVAFILHDDVYTTSVEYPTTRRITNTPEQERDLDFAPDGRSLVYASERNGCWQIYRSVLVKAGEPRFTYATEVREEQLVKSDSASFQPKVSPDGKEVAFLENRTTLRILNLQSRLVRTVMEGRYEYSYADGDQQFAWSPDSRYLLSSYIGHGGWNNRDIALVDASGQKPIVNLTESGYSDQNPKWVLGGKAMLWMSDRAGYRSHGSWGTENDYYLMFFDLEAYERFLMSKEDLALADSAQAAKPVVDPVKKDGKKATKAKAKAEDSDKIKPLILDLDHRFDRIVRLTPNSSRLGEGVLTPKGDRLLYQARFEGDYDLWEQDLKERKTRIVMKHAGGGMILDKKGENLFLAGSSIRKVNTKTGTAEEVKFSADFDYRPAEERTYIFDHAWQQVKDKFYRTDLHGVDWAFYRDSYRRFLPSIDNNYDFAELLSEMLGELNASHTGARYSAPKSAQPTAALGAFFDEGHHGAGLKVKEIVARGPLAVRPTGIRPGCIIEAIDGETIAAGSDYFPLLAGKVGRKVRLSVFDPSAGKRFNTEVRPISQDEQDALLYKRWVKRNREMVDSLSGGRLAYVHVEGMDSPSFREVYSTLLSDTNRRKVAVIVDTRHNGGGWLHDDLITLLSGREYSQYVPREQYIGSDPFTKWTKPSCLLVCEDNYSNASGFPVIYRDLGLGKIVGAPIPGTMTAVWWERQLDPSLVFGIPQVGVRNMQGVYGENTLLTPDIVVYNTPEEEMAGVDRQLEAAVRHLLEITK